MLPSLFSSNHLIRLDIDEVQNYLGILLAL